VLIGVERDGCGPFWRHGRHGSDLLLAATSCVVLGCGFGDGGLSG
jgi:hypothetical protein